MLNNLKLLPFITAAAFGLNACGDHDQSTAGAPVQLSNINSTVYSQLRSASSDADGLFNAVALATGDSTLCDVKLHRMSYGTVGGAGEPTTSSGVFMLPHGTSAKCSGERPVLLYAHGTTSDKSYDLSQFLTDNQNPAGSEAVLMLAAYAAQGYAVIAPNYAGYADSTLGYHPYLDQAQQSTEMMNALDHVRTHASTLGANLSSKLFISGLSQGGYVAMATHKALEASGETVTASMPVSGPYAMLEFIDRIFEGYVNLGATVFGPMALTALDKSADIYTNTSEVYSTRYAATAETSLPATGGMTAAVTGGKLPEGALFSGAPPSDAETYSYLGFDQSDGKDQGYLLSDAFRSAYNADAQTNPSTPANKFRTAIKALDLRGWTPKAPVLMCGSNKDAVVYFSNTTSMAQHWSTLLGNGLVSVLDLSADLANLPASTPAATKALMTSFQNENFQPGSVHGNTGAFCATAGLGYFGQF